MNRCSWRRTEAGGGEGRTVGAELAGEQAGQVVEHLGGHVAAAAEGGNRQHQLVIPGAGGRGAVVGEEGDAVAGKPGEEGIEPLVELLQFGEGEAAAAAQQGDGVEQGVEIAEVNRRIEHVAAGVHGGETGVGAVGDHCGGGIEEPGAHQAVGVLDRVAVGVEMAVKGEGADAVDHQLQTGPVVALGHVTAEGAVLAEQAGAAEGALAAGQRLPVGHGVHVVPGRCAGRHRRLVGDAGRRQGTGVGGDGGHTGKAGAAGSEGGPAAELLVLEGLADQLHVGLAGEAADALEPQGAVLLGGTGGIAADITGEAVGPAQLHEPGAVGGGGHVEGFPGAHAIRRIEGGTGEAETAQQGLLGHGAFAKLAIEVVASGAGEAEQRQLAGEGRLLGGDKSLGIAGQGGNGNGHVGQIGKGEGGTDHGPGLGGEQAGAIPGEHPLRLLQAPAQGMVAGAVAVNQVKVLGPAHVFHNGRLVGGIEVEELPAPGVIVLRHGADVGEAGGVGLGLEGQFLPALAMLLQQGHEGITAFTGHDAVEQPALLKAGQGRLVLEDELQLG